MAAACWRGSTLRSGATLRARYWRPQRLCGPWLWASLDPDAFRKKLEVQALFANAEVEVDHGNDRGDEGRREENSGDHPSGRCHDEPRVNICARGARNGENYCTEHRRSDTDEDC